MKDIKNYEGLYAITEDGQVYSYRSKKFLKPRKNKQGYLQVILQHKGIKKCKRIHRLIMETYCPCEDMENLQVNHLNEIRDDNRLENLNWVTCKENINYGSHNERVAAAKKKKIRCIETDVIYNSIGEAAKAINRSISSLSCCLTGRQKTCGGFHWEYVVD